MFVNFIFGKVEFFPDPGSFVFHTRNTLFEAVQDNEQSQSEKERQPRAQIQSAQQITAKLTKPVEKDTKSGDVPPLPLCARPFQPEEEL